MYEQAYNGRRIKYLYPEKYCMQILGLLYFMLPAYVANILPPLIRKWNILNVPLDFGMKLKGKPILGSHKTWRGLVFGTCAGTLIFFFQQRFIGISESYAIIDYSTTPILLGLLLSFGALFGDAIKSLIKRQIGVRPGKPWYIADQVDYIVGALAFASWYYLPTTLEILTIIAVSLILTIIAKHIGYYIRVNKVAW